MRRASRVFNSLQKSKYTSKKTLLKSNLALCVKNKELPAAIQKQLAAISFNIMGKVKTVVNKEINSLTKQKKTIKNTSVRTSTKEHYNKSLATTRNRLDTLERSITEIYQRQYQM